MGLTKRLIVYMIGFTVDPTCAAIDNLILLKLWGIRFKCKKRIVFIVIELSLRIHFSTLLLRFL